MKHIISTIKEHNGNVSAQHALFIFLKFMTAVIPTIEYDFTVDINMG